MIKSLVLGHWIWADIATVRSMKLYSSAQDFVSVTITKLMEVERNVRIYY